MTDANDYLKDEYFKLQDHYEDFDRRALQIKGWVGAASIASLAFGLDDKTSGNGLMWLLITAVAGCCWYLEAKWKLFQYATADRIRILEAHFRNEQELLPEFRNPKPLQMFHWWFLSYTGDNPIYPYETAFRPRAYRVRLWRAACQSFVHLPYSLIMAISLVCWIMSLIK